MPMRNIAIWAVVLVLVMVLVQMVGRSADPATTQRGPSYSDFLDRVERNEIESATIQGDTLFAVTASGERFEVVLPPSDTETVGILREADVNIRVEEPSEEGNIFLSMLFNWFPLLLLIGVWIFFMRQMQGGGRGGAMGFGKSKARLLTEHHGRKTFDDVAGVDEAKEELQEVVEFLKDPSKFQRLGGKIPKGALLVGPPGTGKTLLARAVAGEANVPFFSISGSDFVEMFVGVGASRVRDMFEQAKKNAPCIIFIDEIDAVGRSRGAGIGGGNDEREQTLNQLLVEMDGFETNEGIILIAATNRPDVLDPALRRPGRFDREVVVGNPDILGREKILKVHMREVPLSEDVDVKIIARGTPGFSGADLANLVNEAALLAARRNKRRVAMQEFEDAKDKVMMGPERRSMVMTDAEKKLTAYHEAGHAIVGLNMPQHDPLHKVTIIPRGRALGVTFNLPEADRLSYSRQYCVSRLASLFGGREAEIIALGPENVTNGATSDIQQATGMARAMVMEWGMSETLGRVRYENRSYEAPAISPDTSELIDKEVRSLIEDAETTARRILTERRSDLDTLAEGLLEFEILSGQEVKDLLNGKRPERPDETTPPPSDTPSSAVPSTDEEPDTGPEPQGA
ncbi:MULTISPECIES: ATP-dependent zinc metalloprotease FtsH [Maricaulis]|jgi:cell division protease FtsH|uniref:ATP-dependent zinc metalloprotease FtsH n=1 Tax=Maricaulis TaxID=74317 RepID=UPI000C590421|nr:MULTISPECIES: ATP-dependent zinc metalloprotease FtsH [Maricaulis]MAC88629.1 cell division protein FtsH [Maricaulis sp.]